MKKDLRKLTAWMLTLAMLVTLIPGFTIGAGATEFFEITEVDEVELMAEEISAPTFSADIQTVSYTNGEGLAGAKMQLLNSEDRVVDEWTSTEEIHTIEGLAAGNEYTVRVNTAPKGFILSTDTTFSITDEGKISSTGMVDEEGTILVGFDKTKLVIMTEGVVFDDETDKVTICFLNSEGSSVSSLDMTSESHELSGIPTGVEFTLHVADAPVGYVLPEDEKFTIDVDGWVDCSGNTATDEYGNNAILLKFEPASSVYNIWAGDKQFTSENLTISDNNGGTATYDPDTNTLTLNNFTYSGEGRLLYGRPSGATAISYDDADTLNIVLVGESSVTCNNTTTEVNSGIWVANGSVSVSGSGSLTATGGAAEFFSAGIGVAGELSVSGSVSLTGIGGASDDKSYGVMAGRNIHVIGGSLTGNGGIAGNKSYGMYVTTIDGPAAGGIKFSGGVAIAHGETDAFNIVPTINSEFTNAKVWYGESEDAADTAGAKEISELTNNYNQKYIKVADPAEITAYTITVAHTENGTVEADASEARKGETVTLTVTPATGYELDTLSVEDSDSEDVEINENKFTMPEADVTVTATFKKVYDVFVGGIGMEDGTYLASGADEIVNKKPSGGHAYYNDGTLTLNNYSYEGDGYLFDEAENSYTIVYAESSLDIVLEGTNNILNSHYVYEGENKGFGIVVTEDLTISGNGTLNFSGDEYGVYAGGNIKVLGGNMDFDVAVGFASKNGDILIGGGDIYTHSSYGLVAEGTAEIAGGEVEIFAERTAIVSGKAILSGGIIEFDTWGKLIEAMDVSISEDLMLILPAGGEIIREEGLPHEICDSEGFSVDDALLAPACEHSWSEEYRINSTHHWHYCTKDCIINNYPEGCEGYESHSEDGECICGYDVNKEAEIYIGGVGLVSGEYLSTGGALSQEKPDGGYAYYDEGTLTLKNFEFKGTGYDYYYEDYYGDYYEGNALIYTEDNLDIVITGENRIEAVREEFDGIFSYGGDITVSGKGSLTLIGGDDAIGTYEGDVTIKSGTLTLEAKDDDGIDIYGGNLYVKGGTINITSDDHGADISASEEIPDSGKVTITGGKITINAGDEGFDAEGYVKITGGTINVTAYDIPIDAYNGIMIKGGKLTLVSESDEGIWVTGDFEMTGGTLDITAVTQGIEATCYIGEDGSPQNKGGNIYIDGGELNVTVTEGYALFAEDDIEIDKALTIKTPKNAKIIDAQYTEDAVDYEGVTVGKNGEGAKEVEIKKESSGGGGGGSSKGSSSSGGIKIPTGTPTLPVVPAPGTTGGQTPAKKEFADVHPLGHWASADIDYVYANGLMKGISETEFGPEAPLTRAMLVTVLYRIEGEPATNRSIPFSDVDMGAYYAIAVSWAKQVGIVMGVTETEFAPDLNISREQIAAIMHRYAEYKGYDVTQGGMLIREFDDYEEISEYALTAMAWTVNSGLLKGKGENSLAPEENATRAETAAILHRFIEGNK